MKYKINPMVDCVFKAILGSENHKSLLIHFLNAVLVPYGHNPIKEVTLLNPYSMKQFETDKLTIVDIKAKDEEEKIFQIEVHLSIEPDLSKHILYNWSEIYQSQLTQGDKFDELRPVISIWLLDKNLFRNSSHYHHRFLSYDPVNKIQLTDDFNIHILEIEKWNFNENQIDEEDRWLYFFREGKNIDIDSPPKVLLTKEMEEAMGVLREFSEQEKQHDIYQRRMRTLSMVASYKGAIEEAKKQLEESEKIREESEKLREESEKLREESEKLREESEKLREESEKENQQLKLELEKQKTLIEELRKNRKDTI